MKVGNFTFDSVILCEEIRQEVGGGSILLGVRSNDLITASYPAVMPWCVFIEGEVISPGRFSGSFQFMDEKDAALSEVCVLGLSPKPFFRGRFSVAFQTTVTFQKSSRFFIRGKIGDHPWRNLSARNIRLPDEMRILAEEAARADNE